MLFSDFYISAKHACFTICKSFCILVFFTNQRAFTKDAFVKYMSVSKSKENQPKQHVQPSEFISPGKVTPTQYAHMLGKKFTRLFEGYGNWKHSPLSLSIMIELKNCSQF